jgi:TetR/AcrR family transcriptional regulator, transcriptional repressor for nem operon
MARPREFNSEKVLSQITDLFWEKGFEGTSMDDLVKTTGLNKGSLYTCFGNKEKIFTMAIEYYASRGPFANRRSKSAIKTLRSFYARLISEVDLPKKQRRGCFVFNSCLEFGNKSVRLTPIVVSIGKKTESHFQKLIEEAKQNGEIPRNIDCKKGAQRAFAAAFTIREMAKFKPERDFLCEIANSTLASLCTKSRVST